MIVKLRNYCVKCKKVHEPAQLVGGSASASNDYTKNITELLSRFMLPPVSTKGYESKPRPELTGASAVDSNEVYKIKAVMELIDRTIIR